MELLDKVLTRIFQNARGNEDGVIAFDFFSFYDPRQKLLVLAVCPSNSQRPWASNTSLLHVSRSCAIVTVSTLFSFSPVHSMMSFHRFGFLLLLSRAPFDRN